MVIAGMKVLISERWNDGKFDILLKYDDKQTKLLKKYGEFESLDQSVLEWQREEDERLYGTTEPSVDIETLVDFEDQGDDDFVDDI